MTTESLNIEENTIILIKKALSKHKGSVIEASVSLKISERNLYHKMNQYKLNDYVREVRYLAKMEKHDKV